MDSYHFDTLGGNAIDFCGHNEVALRQTVYLVGIKHDFNAAPTEAHVWMMPFLFCKCTDLIDELQRRFEIRELEFTFDMVGCEQGPFRDLFHQRSDFAAAQCGYGAGARNTLPVRKFCHGFTSLRR